MKKIIRSLSIWSRSHLSRLSHGNGPCIRLELKLVFSIQLGVPPLDHVFQHFSPLSFLGAVWFFKVCCLS